MSATPSLLPKHNAKWSEEQCRELEDIARMFTVTTEQLESMAGYFVEQMRGGLEEEDSESQDLAMIPSYVTGRPDGHERGSYLALDLGGTNLRVCLISLKGNHQLEIQQRTFKVPTHLQRAEVHELMNFIATSIKDFISNEHINAKICEHSVGTDTLELGFTFSFPVDQTSIDGGLLLRWTKGYDCPGAVGNDIVKLLQDALDRNNVNVHIAALINDTVGTLLAYSYSHPGTYIGAIFGTGTNGAYVENIENIKKMGSAHNDAEEMIINTEWGNFDSRKKFLPVTEFDIKLDEESINPGIHNFEKLISGMYLGEICRNVLIHLIDKNILFEGTSSDILKEQWAFETKYMSAIENDKSLSLIPTAEVLEQKLGVTLNTLVDREIVKFVCRLIGERAAKLSAMAVSAVIRQGLAVGALKGNGYSFKLTARDAETIAATNGKSEGNGTTGNTAPIYVSIDGSVFQYYPGFEQQMEKTIVELLGEHAKDLVKMGVAEDASGVGAALAALIATKKKGATR
ncbi:glucokinase [Entomortierella beljakovae]|nr:glucokinase [Entomortierella beljakovae]